MNSRLIGDFTRRLSQCNQGEMIVIIYDIFFAYVEDIKGAKDAIEYKQGIRKAQETLDELINSLDFKYDLAKTLYPLYQYCKESLAKALYENRLDRVNEVEQIMRRLYDSFKKVAAKDTSQPIMTNTQQVYAGMTYGKFELNENYSNDTHRGFLV